MTQSKSKKVRFHEIFWALQLRNWEKLKQLMPNIQGTINLMEEVTKSADFDKIIDRFCLITARAAARDEDLHQTVRTIEEYVRKNFEKIDPENWQEYLVFLRDNANELRFKELFLPLIEKISGQIIVLANKKRIKKTDQEKIADLSHKIREISEFLCEINVIADITEDDPEFYEALDAGAQTQADAKDKETKSQRGGLIRESE